MNGITDNIKAQWSKQMNMIFDYVPTKYKADSTEWRIRKFVWDFKNGKKAYEAAKIVAYNIQQQYGNRAKGMVFMCVPASTEEKNAIRYKQFSQMVCKFTGMANGYDAVTVEGERLAIHESHSSKRIESVQIINVDTNKINNKQVLIFDDIITKGFSYARFACEVERKGAQVVGGIFLAKTIIKSN